MNSISRSIGVFSASLLFSTAVSAQGEPEALRTKNHDLRGEKAVFSVKSHQGDGEKFALLETGGNQYMMELPSGDRRKVSSDFAQEVDGNFVKDFIDLKYAMEKKEGKCEKAVTLTMRSEAEQVCRGEDQRLAKVSSLVKTLKRKLNIK